MELTTDIEYPSDVWLNEDVKKAVIKLIESLNHKEPPEAETLSVVVRDNNEFKFRKQTEVGNRLVYDLSEYTNESTLVKVATNESGARANMVEHNDRELLSEQLRQHIIPTVDLLEDGYGLIQLNLRGGPQNKPISKTEVAGGMINEIAENTDNIDLTLSQFDATWFRERPVAQHWGQTRR